MVRKYSCTASNPAAFGVHVMVPSIVTAFWWVLALDRNTHDCRSMCSMYVPGKMMIATGLSDDGAIVAACASASAINVKQIGGAREGSGIDHDFATNSVRSSVTGGRCSRGGSGKYVGI